jgi:hypothetical protein
LGPSIPEAGRRNESRRIIFPFDPDGQTTTDGDGRFWIRSRSLTAHSLKLLSILKAGFREGAERLVDLEDKEHPERTFAIRKID